MNQYCRYCCDANLTDCEDTFWCSMHKKEYAVSKAKRINKCKDFQFNPYDLFRMDENGNFKEYSPRLNKKKNDKICNQSEADQMKLWW